MNKRASGQLASSKPWPWKSKFSYLAKAQMCDMVFVSEFFSYRKTKEHNHTSGAYPMKQISQDTPKGKTIARQTTRKTRPTLTTYHPTSASLCNTEVEILQANHISRFSENFSTLNLEQILFLTALSIAQRTSSGLCALCRKHTHSSPSKFDK